MVKPHRLAEFENEDGDPGKDTSGLTWRGENMWSDSRIAAQIKGNIYKTVVKPTMTYGLEPLPRQKTALVVAELRMLKFSLEERVDKTQSKIDISEARVLNHSYQTLQKPG